MTTIILLNIILILIIFSYIKFINISYVYLSLKILLICTIVYLIYLKPTENFIFFITSLIFITAIYVLLNLKNNLLRKTSLFFLILSIITSYANLSYISKYSSSIFLILFLVAVLKEKYENEI
jgi:hypothetical protein